MIDWTKVTDNEDLIRLIKEREKIEEQIRAIDEMALIRYELEVLQEFISAKEKEVSEDAILHLIIKDSICPQCGDHTLYLISNPRSDARELYKIFCYNCKQKVGFVDFYYKIHYKIEK